MSTKYHIVPSHLELDELVYELEYRGFPTLRNVSEMRKELRKILNLEKIGVGGKYPETNKSFADEVHSCNEKIKALSVEIDKFSIQSDRREFLILNSRLSHLMARADRLPMTDNDQKTQRASVITKVLQIADKLTKTLKSRGSQGHNETVSFLQSSSDSEEDVGNIHASTPSRSVDIVGNPNPNRPFGPIKSVPVYKWGLKFSGESKGLSVGAFLERVDELKLARGVSDDELFLSALDLFTGRALNWYRELFFPQEQLRIEPGLLRPVAFYCGQ